MKTAVFKPLFLCLLVLSACSRENELFQAHETDTPLQLAFQWGDDLSMQGTSSRALVNGFGTGGGQINTIGVYVTTADHQTYPSVGKQNFIFTPDNGKWVSTDNTTIYLNSEKALVQVFSPANATVTPDNANGKHTIPVSIPATQTFNGTNDWEIDATDYLFGSATTALSSVSPITVYNKEASKQVYLHHALAMVAFSIQYGTTRIPDLENEYVKEIRLESTGNSFLIGTSSNMQIGDGTLSGLTTTNKLTFNATSGTERNIGYANSPTVTAYGLVAPLNDTPTSDITLVVKIGARGNATKDKEYKLAQSDFKVKWQRGYCYTYNLILNDGLGVESTSVSWGNGEGDEVTGKEKGISNATELLAFVDTWNKNGLGASGDDYTPYLDYGWYETDAATGKKKFIIKLTAHITVAAEVGKLWTPNGTDEHPLALPFDGQGWQIVLDLNGSVEKMESKYAGFIGYTKADIRNLRVTTLPNGDGVTNNIVNAAGEAIYVGGLAGKVDGNITNCSVELTGTTLINSHEGGNDMCIGGLAGWCNGSISNCAVYEGSVAFPATIACSKPGTDCYIGGLVGKLAGSGSIANSYSYIKTLENKDSGGSNLPTAGWLAGTTEGGSVVGSYYREGTMKSCTTATAAGTSITDFTGLCANLNTEVEKDNTGWAYWKEVVDNNTKDVIQVILELYR